MPTSKADWTILTYIAAHNNLAELGQQSLAQIMKVGSTSQVQLVALYDAPDNAARYVVREIGHPAIEEPLNDFDSGAEDTLLETARWAFQKCPAEHYGLILWSHGSGWRPEEIREVAKQARGDSQVTSSESTERAAAPGSLALFRSSLVQMLQPEKPADRAILFDDGTGHSLDTLALERVTIEIQKVIGQPLDLLGMDACLMATLEVAYQLRNSVHYLVASQELVPGFSWPYELIFGDLRADPGQSSAKLVTTVVQRYTEYYTAHPPGAGDVTKVALDLSGAGDVAQAVDNLAQAVQAAMPSYADVLWKAQWDALMQESRNRKREPNKFQYHLWDIGSLAKRLADAGSSSQIREAAQAIDDALKPGGPFVLAEGHYGSWFDGIGGVSIYMIPPRKPPHISPYYSSLALSADTHWDEMLTKYHDALADA
jgi:hypothetical protein